MDEDTEQSNVDKFPASTSLPKIETKWESDCPLEFQLKKENVTLKKNLDILKSESQMKTVELSRVVE